MNKSLQFVVICAVISLTCAKTIIPVPEEVQQRTRPIEKKCIEESGSVPNSLYHMLNGSMPEDMSSKKFLRCFCDKTEFLNENGLFVVDNLLKLLPTDIENKDDFAMVLQECNKNKNPGDLTEFLYIQAKCFYKNSPIFFTVPLSS